MNTQNLKSTLIILSLFLFQFSCKNSDSSSTKEFIVSEEVSVQLPHDTPVTPDASKLNVRLSNELVCMVNDTFMGRKQFPVPVGDKIYYGCCEMCVGKLQNTDEYRFGIDPLTHEKVDKVEAYIVLASEETGMVYYFANKENYKKFTAKI